MTFRRRMSAGSQSGFASEISGFGTSNWIVTVLAASWIFFSKKSRQNPSRTFFVIGRTRGEVGRDPSILDLFHNLPSDVQDLAVKNYRLWRQNPNHPSLHFRCLRVVKIVSRYELVITIVPLVA